MMLVHVIGAGLLAYAAAVALRARSKGSRLQILAAVLYALAMVLFIRLIAAYGGWDGWFIYVWLLAIAALTLGTWRAARAWPRLTWRMPAEPVAPAARRAEVRAVLVNGGAVLAVLAVLVVPGLLLS